MIDTGIIIDLEGVKKKRHADSIYGKSKSEIEKELFETHADCKRLAGICKDACMNLAAIRVECQTEKPSVEKILVYTNDYEDWVE